MISERIAWMAAGFVFGIPAGWFALWLAMLFAPQPSDRIVQDVRVGGGL